MLTTSFFSGLALGAGLIAGIGAQNLHVIRAGIGRHHVSLTVFTCVAVDAILISLGVAGAGAALQSAPHWMLAARWGGAAFLFWYGLRSWRAVFAPPRPEALGQAPRLGRRQAIAAILALSLLNPHVYLDTLVLLGTVGSSYPADERPAFTLGAICASTLWFSMIGFGSSRLGPLFTRPAAWKWLDAIGGSVMLILALGLVLSE